MTTRCTLLSGGIVRLRPGVAPCGRRQIRAAIAAGLPWLDVYCPGCRTSRAIDIRTIDRHPLASVGSLVLGLRCSWCPGSAPMPVTTGLHASPPAAIKRGSMDG